MALSFHITKSLLSSSLLITDILMCLLSVVAFADEKQSVVQNNRPYNTWIPRPYDADEFYFSYELKNRREADVFCKSQNSALINFEDVLPELYLFIETVGLDKYLYFADGTFHIGLEKRIGSKYWIWTISNLSLKLRDSRFQAGLNDRPFSNSECTYSSLSGQWFYEDCDSPVERLFICQRRKTVFKSCADYPCLNQGICAQGVGQEGFICLCPKGLTGAHCETDIPECSMNQPCKNKGICVEQFGSYACVCDESHKGKNCEQSRVFTTAVTEVQEIEIKTKADEEESCQFWFFVAVALLILVSLATPVGLWMFCSLCGKSRSAGSKRIFRPLSKSVKVIQKKITGKQELSPPGLLLPGKV